MEHPHNVSALEWAAEHAADLGARPSDLSVAGLDDSAAHAAWLAINARGRHWLSVGRQLLIHPKFEGPRPTRSLVDRVAPATVVCSVSGSDDGPEYAALLRRSGVEVRELHEPPPYDTDFVQRITNTTHSNNRRQT
jgi:hypothetical protein